MLRGEASRCAAGARFLTCASRGVVCLVRTATLLLCTTAASLRHVLRANLNLEGFHAREPNPPSPHNQLALLRKVVFPRPISRHVFGHLTKLRQWPMCSTLS